MIENRHKTSKTLILEWLCTRTVQSLFLLIILYLAWLSMTVTCTVYGGAEIIEYNVDWPFTHFVALAVVLGIMIQFCRKQDNGSIKAMGVWKFRRCLILAAVFLIVWLVLTQFLPISDQRLCLQSAQALLKGNYLPWAPVAFSYGSKSLAGYAYTYPTQNGLILYFAAVSALFKHTAPYVLQFLNIIFLILGMYSLCRFMESLEIIKSAKGMATAMVLYLPFAFYFTFIYGTVPGFAFSNIALYYGYGFLKTGGWKSFLISALSITAAVLLKSNYLIVLAAMVIYLATGSLFKKKLRYAAAALLLILLHLAAGRAVNGFLGFVTAQPMGQGIPMAAWIEMGLQDSERGPGWYNGYHIWIFSQNQANSEKTAETVEADLKQTLEEFADDPKAAASFFNRKASSIWAEPTFQSLWIQEVKGGSWLIPGFTRSLFKSDGFFNGWYVSINNYLQTLIYIGALLYILLCWKQIGWFQLFPAVIFIGGFLFHMFWEAKGQYSVCYFILLIPYAAAGLKTAAEGVTSIILRRRPV